MTLFRVSCSAFKLLTPCAIVVVEVQLIDKNFESIEDSAKDLINYSSFIASYCRGGIDGQDPNKDFLNREIKHDIKD